MSAITRAAERIARRHNEMRHGGGVLAFDDLGEGGEWYARQDEPSAAIVFPITRRRIDAREVQDWLDTRP